MLDSLTTFKQMKLFQKLLCSVISHVMIFTYPKKLNITTKKHSCKDVIVISSVLLQCNLRKYLTNVIDTSKDEKGESEMLAGTQGNIDRKHNVSINERVLLSHNIRLALLFFVHQ